MTPIGPLSSATTRISVDPTVTRMFATLADTNATERSSTRKRLVSCVQFIPAQRPTNEAATSFAVLRGPEEELRELARERDADDEAERRHGHDEPEGGSEDATPSCRFVRVEVEAEERAPDSCAESDADDGGERDQCLHHAVVRGREIARVERQEEDGEDARDEPAEPVDRRVLAEPF